MKIVKYRMKRCNYCTKKFKEGTGVTGVLPDKFCGWSCFDLNWLDNIIF